MPIEQKMEIAIHNAPLTQGLRHELGDIRMLVASFVVATAVLMAVAATGVGALIEGVTIAFLLAGAALSGAQIGRGINSLMDFHRQCERAKNEEDLKKAGLIFAEGVAAIGLGALFLLLSFLGARARGAAGGAAAAEESAEVAPKGGGEPPPEVNEPGRIPDKPAESPQAPPSPQPAESLAAQSPQTPPSPQSANPAESPKIEPNELSGKTRSEIRDLARDKGLTPKGDPSNPDYPRKWSDPVTGEDRLRLDRGHVDPSTGQPYNNPNAAADHVHGYDPNGDPILVDGDKHIPTTGE